MGGGQCFSLSVPNTNVSINAGSGPVDGMSFTTDANAFHHAKSNAIHESKAADIRIVCSKVLGACAGTGVIIGTPCTIQVTAGGAIQVYAGAGISPVLGTASGPGEAFGPSQPASFAAGDHAASMNKINDGIGGVLAIAGGVMDIKSALTGSSEGIAKVAEVAAGGVAALSGAWTVTKAATGTESSNTDYAAAYGEAGFGALAGILTGDPSSAIASAAKGIAKYAESATAAHAGDAAGNPTPATGPTCVDGAAGGAMGAPGDGSARIHEVAPANIDRKCGKDMMALVAGKKETKVDGKIDYQSGASISFKAFNKISNQSLFFDATGLVSAKVVGYATVKVESFGKATVSGKAKFEVKTWGKGKVEAGSLLEIKTKGGPIKITAAATLNMKATGAATLHAADVGVVATGTISLKAPTVHLRGEGIVHKKLSVNDALDVKKAINAGKGIRAKQKIENPYFTAG